MRTYLVCCCLMCRFAHKWIFRTAFPDTLPPREGEEEDPDEEEKQGKVLSRKAASLLLLGPSRAKKWTEIYGASIAVLYDTAVCIQVRPPNPLRSGCRC